MGDGDGDRPTPAASLRMESDVTAPSTSTTTGGKNAVNEAMREAADSYSDGEMGEMDCASSPEMSPKPLGKSRADSMDVLDIISGALAHIDGESTKDYTTTEAPVATAAPVTTAAPVSEPLVPTPAPDPFASMPVSEPLVPTPAPEPAPATPQKDPLSMGLEEFMGVAPSNTVPPPPAFMPNSPSPPASPASAHALGLPEI
jgi:hypothetical protein